MKIADDHLYHGAALIQIAEHEHFTSINSLVIKSDRIHNSFRINDNIGVHLKYCSNPKGQHDEYAFTFSDEHLKQLERIDKATGTFYLGLVCVAGKEICALPFESFKELVERRRTNNGGKAESQYVLLLTIPQNSAFRVYVSPVGTKGKTLGTPLKIARNKFPNALFDT